MKRGKTKRQAATLAEVMIGLTVFSLFALAILGTLIQAARLEQNEAEHTRITLLAQALLERNIDRSRGYQGFHSLANIALTASDQIGYLYARRVSDLSAGLKKITVSVYRADPADPSQLASAQPKALTLSVTVGEPHP